MYWIDILISAALSGLFVMISNWYHQRNENRRIKFQVLMQLIGNRHDLTGQLFTEALSHTLIAFHDSQDVIAAWEMFYATVKEKGSATFANQGFVTLTTAMCNCLGINPKSLVNKFLSTFNIK